MLPTGAFDPCLALFDAGHSYLLIPCPKDPQPRLRAHKGTFHVILTNYRKTKIFYAPGSTNQNESVSYSTNQPKSRHILHLEQFIGDLIWSIHSKTNNKPICFARGSPVSTLCLFAAQ